LEERSLCRIFRLGAGRLSLLRLLQWLVPDPAAGRVRAAGFMHLTATGSFRIFTGFPGHRSYYSRAGCRLQGGRNGVRLVRQWRINRRETPAVQEPVHRIRNLQIYYVNSVLHFM
jgi:hypothetical protein